MCGVKHAALTFRDDFFTVDKGFDIAQAAFGPYFKCLVSEGVKAAISGPAGGVCQPESICYKPAADLELLSVHSIGMYGDVRGALPEQIRCKGEHDGCLAQTILMSVVGAAARLTFRRSQRSRYKTFEIYAHYRSVRFPVTACHRNSTMIAPSVATKVE